nr:MAG TPA: hypothetical protein [Caudoviricetes sp.]
MWSPFSSPTVRWLDCSSHTGRSQVCAHRP